PAAAAPPPAAPSAPAAPSVAPVPASAAPATGGAAASATGAAAQRNTSAEESATDSLLANAGYPLTPGVTSDPVKPEFVLSGYVQAQYESHQDSMDQLRQGGAALNLNRFLIRRGRVRVSRDWDYAQVIVEVDGNTTRGPTMRFQKVEASLLYGRSKDK